MSFKEDLSSSELLEHLIELGFITTDMETFLDPWQAVGGAAVVCLLAVIVYFLLLKKVGESNMDSLFKLIFKLQTTQSLVNANLLLVVFVISGVNSTDGPLRLFLCRFVTSVGISLNVSFIFSLFLIALTRVAYTVFPVYIHKLPKAVLQVAIVTGWSVIACGFFAALYTEEVFAVKGVYYCLGLSTENVDGSVMLAVIFPLINVMTVLAYVFIIVQLFKRKDPRRRHQAQVCGRKALMLGVS